MLDLKNKLLNFCNKGWPYFAIILVALSFFWKVVIKGQIPFPGDFVVGVYYPWLDYKWGFPVGVPVKNPIIADVPSLIYPCQMLAVDLMKKGQWPLWNPRILGGVPLMANFQSAPFSPTVIFHFIFNQTTAWTIQIILAHFFAALFTYLLLRWWKVSKLGSILGGIIFAFSGYNLIWSQFNGHTLAAAFIPLIVLFEDRWLEEKKILNLLGLSVALCFQVFSGYPQTTYYSLLAGGLLWLVKIFRQKEVIFKTICLAISFLLGMGLAAPQILVGKEFLSLSQWTAEWHPFEWTFLPWQKIITFLAPDYFGNHATQNYWGLQDYTSNTGFVGVTAFVLATLGIFLFKKRKEIIFLISLLIAVLLLSFPTFLSIFIWQHNIIGMGSSSAHRILVLFNFSIAALAAFGFDKLKFKIERKNLVIAILIPFIIFLIFGIYAFTLKGVTKFNIEVTPVALRNLIFPFAILVLTALAVFWKRKFYFLLILICIFELFRFGWKYTPFSSTKFVFPTTPVLDFLMSQAKPFRITANKVIPVNLASAYGLESLEGYETMRLLISSQILASINENSSSASPTGRYGIMDNDTSRLLDLVNTKYYLGIKINQKGIPDSTADIPYRFKNSRFKKVFEDKSVVVMESNSTLPRAFMVYEWDVEGDDKKTLDKLLEPKFSMETKIILKEKPGINTSNISQTSEVKYEKYEEQESLIKVRTEREGMLFISDTYYPGWKAYVDGQETKIYQADYAFRAIVVPAGTHEVKFVYHPDSFFTGLKISLISFLGLFIFGLIFKLLGKKEA
jgi:hypothetical protein